MNFLTGFILAVTAVQIKSDAYTDSIYQGCSAKRCQYYAQLSLQASPLLQAAGYQLYRQCLCGSTNVATTKAPSPYSPTVSSQCGSSSITGSASTYVNSQRARVVGGKDTLQCEFPWLAFVNAGGAQCGGTIIDSYHIVTAAHCLRNGYYTRPASSIRVGVGSSNKNSLTYYNVQRVTVHPNYNAPTFDYDIAVLRLQSPLPSNNRCIKPICLPSNRLVLKTGVKCTVAGWGLIGESSGYTPNTLQEATLPIVSMETCRRSYGSQITSMKICAGYLSGGIDACQGDSGGPLMCAEGESWVLAGIVSFGNGCARPNFPGVYTYVPNLKTWVDSITRS